MLTPRPYQEEGRDFLAARRHALLADEMRVGKTPQAVLAAQKVLAQKTLVVCPAIAVQHWMGEWWRWWRQAGVAPVVVSYDRLRMNAEGILANDWDLAIVDECHFAKNPEAQRTKLIYGKGGVGWKAKRMWVLSGTPAPKHAAELWPMLKAFGAVGMTYDEFVRYFCTVNPLTLKVTGTKEARIPELRAILSKIMLRRTRKDVAPGMPAIDFQFLEVQPELPADYQIPADLSDDDLLAWLEAHQNADKEDRQAVAMAKVKPLAEQIEFAIKNGLLKQTVVFGWHVEPLTALCGKLRALGIRAHMITGGTDKARRQEIQDEFRTGSVEVVCANILAAGTAIDLSSARHAYFLELDWVPGNNAQAANRLVSMDKLDKVTIDVCTWPGSTDDRIQRTLLTRVRQLSKIF